MSETIKPSAACVLGALPDASGPDAELIAACDLRCTLELRMKALIEGRSKCDADCDEIVAANLLASQPLDQKIFAMEVQTSAGLLALLRAFLLCHGENFAPERLQKMRESFFYDEQWLGTIYAGFSALNERGVV